MTGSNRRWRGCFQSTSRPDKFFGLSPLVPRYPYVSYPTILGTVFASCVCQDDNRGVAGREGEGELVRPLSRFETVRILALAKQRMAGRVTSFSEGIALRELQLYQVGFIENGSIDVTFFFLKGETESGYKGVAFPRYRYAYDADPARRSTLCACSTRGARCAPSNSDHPIRTLVRSACLRAHTTKDTRIDRSGLGIACAMDTAYG